MTVVKKANDIDRIVLDTLSKSKSLGIFPTPVDKIIRYAELYVDTRIDLSRVTDSFFAKSEMFMKRGVAKIRGVLDRSEKVIYLDLQQPDVKMRFVKLHEAGHELCPWQGKLHDCLDDDETLDPDISEKFEAEANYFASASMFQVDLFNDKMAELPLELASAIQLSKIFGSSVHASLRRYVEESTKRCALLVLNVDGKDYNSTPKLSIRNYFQSNAFTKEFGSVNWGTEFDISVPFVQDYIFNRRFLKSELQFNIDDVYVDCNYHYFNNGYNVFVLIFPKGETNKSRTKIILQC